MVDINWQMNEPFSLESSRIDFSSILKDGFQYTDILGPALNQLLRMVHADSGFIYLLPSLIQEGVTHSFSGFSQPSFHSYISHPDWDTTSIAAQSLQSLRPMMKKGEDTHSYLERILLDDATSCVVLASPIKLQDQGMGMILLVRQMLDEFTLHDLEVIDGIAAHIAISLENARLFEILHRGKDEWERTFDAILDMLAIVDSKGNLLRVNKAFASRLSLHPRQLIGKSYQQSFYHDPEVAYNCPVQASLMLHASFAEEMKNAYLGADFLISTAPIYSHKKEFLGAVVLARDISERKRLEFILRQQRDYLSNILRNSPDAIVASELEGTILEFNRSAENMTGFTRQEALSLCWLQAFFSEEDCCRLQELISVRADVRDYAAQIRTKSGRQVEINLTLSYLRDENSQPVGIVTIWKDVTDLNRLNRQLIQAERLSSMGELVAGVAHELNNPLTSVMGFSNLILEGQLDERMRSDIEKIRKQGARMQRIVQNLLRFSRQYPPEKTAVDLNEVIRTTLELKVYELKSDCISIEERFHTEPVKVLADANQLGQVFLNLINNAHYAIQAKGVGGVIAITTGFQGDYARISISDNGTGIAKEAMSKIFDPFFTTKPVDKGTGLGLSVSFGIIKEHGGNIYAESAPGAGTVFYIELPVGETTS